MSEPPDTPLQRRIEQRLAELGVSARAASLRVSTNADLIRNVLRGASEHPRSDSLRRIAEALDTTVEWLIAEDDRPAPRGEVRRAEVPLPDRAEMPRNLPVYGTAAGGIIGRGAFQLTPDVVDYVRRPPALMPVPDAYALYVENDSMWPLHKQGDLILVHPHRPPAPGDSVVIQEIAEGGETQAFVKVFVKRTAEQVVTRQLNPEAEVKFRRERVRHVHKVLTVAEMLGV